MVDFFSPVMMSTCAKRSMLSVGFVRIFALWIAPRLGSDRRMAHQVCMRQLSRESLGNFPIRPLSSSTRTGRH